MTTTRNKKTAYEIPAGLRRCTNHIATHVIAKMRSLVDTWTTDDDHFECEIRFGVVEVGDNGKHQFVSGVSGTFFDRIVGLLDNYDGWSQTKPWCEHHDYFFADDQARALRCSIEFDRSPPTVTTVHKQRLRTATLLHVDECEVYDVRVSLSSEKATTHHQVPETVVPSLVRIKQRKSYFIEQWRYDVTRVWSGKSRGEAEKLHKMDAPNSYEIEVEMLDPRVLLRRQNHTDERVAFSLFLKILSLCSSPELLQYQIV
tara:strand:+ start:3562 stop:4335 length:774 start_codon:yes stop_codon:yes gene_type:complete